MEDPPVVPSFVFQESLMGTRIENKKFAVLHTTLLLSSIDVFGPPFLLSNTSVAPSVSGTEDLLSGTDRSTATTPFVEDFR